MRKKKTVNDFNYKLKEKKIQHHPHVKWIAHHKHVLKSIYSQIQEQHVMKELSKKGNESF
jgi:WD repeat and SOF domain-containing protein 1